MPRIPEKKKRSWLPERKDHHREVDNSSFYNSWAWRKKRRRHLQKYPLCIMCHHAGIITNATVVDHIKPIREGGSKMSSVNHQSLCEYHHNQVVYFL